MSNRIFKSRVKVLFKSGTSITLEVAELTVSAIGDRITEMNWTDSSPKIMFISLPDIEAIFEIPFEIPKIRKDFHFQK